MGPIAMPCPASLDDPDTLHDRLQARADRVLVLISDQLHNQQQITDCGFADSVVIIYNLDRLALEFGTPVRFLLRSVTKALIADRIPPTCHITSAHELRCLLCPTLVPRSSDSSKRSDRSDLPVPGAAHA